MSRDPLPVERLTARDAVVVKPTGQSSDAQGTKDTLIEQARAQLAWPDAQLPHRLDRPTRGLVVIARDRAAVAAHNEFIRQGLWTKHYLARIRPTAVAGAPGAPGAPALLGPHRAYLRREGRVARVVRSGGDPSELEVMAIHAAPTALGDFHALIRLDTGRYHQARAMLAALGSPLVGDAEYGGAHGAFYLEHASLYLPDIDTGELVRVYNPTDPQREALHPQLKSALDAAAPRA